MQKATVTASQPTGQWESSYGTLYTFNVTLSDGTTGEVNSKSPQLRFNIGDEVEYESPKPGKLKLNRPNPNGGSYSNNSGGARTSYSGGAKKDYSKQHALTAACTFLNGSKASKEQIVFLADYFANWLKGDSAPAQVQQAAPAEVPTPAPAPVEAPKAAPAPPVFEDDGLPF